MLGSTSKRFLIFNALRLEWSWSESWKNQKEFCLYPNISEQGLLVSPELTEKTNTKRLAHFVCLRFGLCSKWLRANKLYKPQFRSSFIEALIIDATLNVWWSQRIKVSANFCMNSRASHPAGKAFIGFIRIDPKVTFVSEPEGKNACKRLEASTPPEKLSCGFSLVAQAELFPRSPSIPGSYLNSSTSHKLRASSRNREKFFRKKTRRFFSCFHPRSGEPNSDVYLEKNIFIPKSRKGFFLCRLTRDLTRNALRPISRRKF